MQMVPDSIMLEAMKAGIEQECKNLSFLPITNLWMVGCVEFKINK